MKGGLLNRIPRIAFSHILSILNMMKSSDDNEPGYSQYRYFTKKITTKLYGDTFI